MHYRLSLDTPLNETVVAIAAEQIGTAIARLRALERDRTAVHAARRHFKRTRALLGLVEPATRGKTARAGRRRLGAVARKLGASRDAQVAIIAAEDLQKDFSRSSNARAFSDLISFLKARQDRAEERLNRRGVASILDELEKTKANLLKLRFGKGMPALLDSASKTYRKGRSAIEAAFKTGKEDDMHECRKLVQRHWRHMMLLKELAPKQAKARITLAHGLSDALGGHHDLAVLREIVLANPVVFHSSNDVKMLSGCIEKKQKALTKTIEARSAKLFHDKPKAFAKNLHARWSKAARKELGEEFRPYA